MIYDTGKRTLEISLSDDRKELVVYEGCKRLARGRVHHNGVEWDTSAGLDAFEKHKIEGIDFRDCQYRWVEKGEHYFMPLSIVGGSARSWSMLECPSTGLFVSMGGKGFIIPRGGLVAAIAGHTR